MVVMHEARQEGIEAKMRQDIVSKALKEMFVRRRDAKYLTGAKIYSKSGQDWLQSNNINKS